MIRGDPVKIRVGIMQAAVQNCLTLPRDHPAFDRSLALLRNLVAELSKDEQRK